MFEISPTTPIIQRLFDTSLPNSPALWAVLKGHHPGKALVDNIMDPGMCVLRTGAALTYFNRATNQAFLKKAISYFRKIDPVWLVWSQDTTLQPPDLKEAKIIQRLEFFGNNPETPAILRKNIPKDFTIQSINESLLERCEWREEMEFYAGSLENFLLHGIGICMLKGDEIIVEAYASALGKKKAEIGAITREPFRGRGYAPITCAYLIQACEKLGYQAYWSCDADHIESIRVAQKLGFQNEEAYVIYEYNKNLLAITTQ